MSLPLKRIVHHKPVHYPGATRVFTIVKYRPSTSGAPTSSLHDTFFHSIPVRDRKDGDVNCILGFLCKEYANSHCEHLNDRGRLMHWLVNHEESTASECKVDGFTISELSFNAWNLRMPMAIVCNAYCEGSEREPHYDLMVVDTPIH